MVSDPLVRRFSACFVIWFALTSLPISLFAQVVEFGGFGDFESPIIEHVAQNGGAIGGVEVFGATVVDNDEVAAVSLFYRFSGETEFAVLPMREIASSAFYTTRVDTANVPANVEAIEYYIQGEDSSGNLVLRGFAFQPLLRTFNEAVQLTSSGGQQAKRGGLSRVNWLYVAAGILVVGGIVASDRAGDDDCDGGCDVTLTFGRP